MRLLVIAVTSVALFFPLFWLLTLLLGANWSAGIAAFAMYIVFPVVALKFWGSSKSNDLYPSAEEAQANGDLVSDTYTISGAIEIEESEDEGQHFYLAIEPNKTLFLSGQYLYEPVSNGLFPSTKIRVNHHKTLGFTYSIDCIGEALQFEQRPAFKEWQFEEDLVPQDRDILDCSLSMAVAEKT